MNIAKFFALAKEKGLTACQIQVSHKASTSFRLFHHEIDGYSVNESQSLMACGVYKGKFGSAATQKIASDSFEFLIDNIIQAATYNQKEGTAEIFKGSDKYHKKNVYCPALEAEPIQNKIALMKQVENDLFAFDKRISEVGAVEYEENVVSSEFYNSFGLKLKQKSNYFVVDAEVVAKQGEEVKTFFDVVIDNDLKKFDEKAFVSNLCTKLLAKFGGKPCKSNKYPTILQNDVFADLILYFLSSASAEEVQKQSSLLIGKVGQKIASSKLTISEKPLTKNIFFSYFDDEGVATKNKDIVKKGVLTQYFYNLETAKKDGKVSTGNGQWAGNKMGIGFSNIFVKASKHSFEEMIAPIKEGVFITEIQGLGTGMNPQSGDFSCQAEGYMIKDGKLAEPLNLITISGNLLKMLSDIKGFDNHEKLLTSSVSCADVYIKKMSIGGE